MNDSAPQIFVALEASGVGQAIRQSVWAYPTANVGHIVFLVLFAGAVAVMDLRLAGAFAATKPGDVLRQARNVAMLAFAGMVLTGGTLFVAEASHIVLNPVFLAKVALILLGLINVAAFEFMTAPSVRKLGPNKRLPPHARFAGFASLAIWACVAALGRTIAYF